MRALVKNHAGPGLRLAKAAEPDLRQGHATIRVHRAGPGDLHLEGHAVGFVGDRVPETGVHVTAFSDRVVPDGRARIRMQLSAVHTAEGIKTCVAAFPSARERVAEAGHAER
ncbi:hypothetical protein [Micromonospora sp. CB01531]|uniref:hypothetical protein n=1 Tax=Micromonospora sp. CB01531 TaxID=1718947 RepID=UPI00093C98C5|nr:hypothetical protein [Micromonospora sp. CB01531]OKI51506.1 hypothetical protein A6A27_33395 [Micromonospora sp. CB01531]